MYTENIGLEDDNLPIDLIELYNKKSQWTWRARDDLEAIIVILLIIILNVLQNVSHLNMCCI